MLGKERRLTRGALPARPGALRSPGDVTRSSFIPIQASQRQNEPIGISPARASRSDDHAPPESAMSNQASAKSSTPAAEARIGSTIQ